jgi:hypothetical protein
MKKNDDNELNVCHGGFDVATQEKKLGQWTMFVILVLEVLVMKKKSLLS